MFQKFKNRINATRFEFTVHVHTLQPWPQSSRAIAIGWQRGKRRRGATSSVLPLPNRGGQLGTVVRFNEKFQLISTLYKAPGADSKTQLGPFKKKCLILAVLETDGRTHATAALGRVVIDLSEFASIDGQELRTFTVACNKSIHSAVGEPQLTLTIRCRWKKAGADMTEDEVASMSTDTTGSNLTTNLRDFFGITRGKTSKAVKRQEEQDLKGFGSSDAAMATIGEEDGDGGLRGTSSAGYSGGLGRRDTDHTADLDSPQGSLGGDWAAQNMEYDAVGALNLHDDEDYVAPAVGSKHAAAAAAAGGCIAPAGAGSGGMVAGTAVAAATTAAASADGGKRRGWRMQDVQNAFTGRHTAPAAHSYRPAVPSATKATQTDLADVTHMEAQLDDVSSLQDELLIAAALECSIDCGQKRLVLRRPASRTVHSPARRIARTLVCLGRQDGIPFGSVALRQLNACVVSGRSEPRQLALWWTNAVHLRGFLQSLNLAAAAATHNGNTAPKHWAAELFVPLLLKQEKFIYDELVSYVWTHTFVPAVAASRARPASAALAAGVVKRSGQEAALRKWIAALEAVAAQLKQLGREGHIVTLQHQVLLEVMKRMDTLIFHFLITPAAEEFSDGSNVAANLQGLTGPDSPTADGASHQQLLRDPINPNMPMLDHSMLFFTRGVLTFGTGMNLKMATTRFQQWAFGDGGMRDIWANLPAQGQSLFPLLRSTSDLLMMPKDLLLEEGIRADMCDSLPLGTLVWMLQHFQADDFSREGIPFTVLQQLRSEATVVDQDFSSPPVLEVEGECTYYSPTDDMAMDKVEVGEEPGLEYDEDSEEELEALSSLGGDIGSGMGPPLRYKLLHNLWASGVPRSRRITIQRPPSAQSGR